MKQSSLFAVLLIALIILSSGLTKGQEDVKHPPKTTAGKQKKEAAELKRKELRLQLISYLDGVAQKANLLDPIEDRIRVLIEVADAFWLLDKVRATTLFKQTIQVIDNLNSEAEEKSRIASRISSLRQLTLTRIARRDAELAATLLQSAPVPAIDERRPTEMNGQTTARAEMLTQIALTLLKTDPKQSVYLARVALRDGMSQTTRLYLERMREMDRTTADSLLEQALVQSAMRTAGRLFDVLAYWEYTFQPGSLYFGAVSWPRGSQTNVYPVSPLLKQAVLQFAVNALNQNVQHWLVNRESSSFIVQPALLHSVIQQLLPDIAAAFPDAADSLRAELGVLEQAIRTSGQRVPELNAESPRYTTTFDDLLYKAERASTGKERDELYLAIAYQLLFDGQFEKAASMASRIDDDETRYAIADAIYFNWTGSLLASGKTTEALQTCRTIRAFEPRIVALAKIGSVRIANNETVGGEEAFNESETLAAKAPPSAVIGAALLNIVQTRATIEGGVARTFETLSLAVSTINKTTSNNVLWQLLTQQAGTTLKVASLNTIGSPSGGLKSIAVTYPRLGGFTSAFAEASNQDLNQAMRVAHDLNAKAVSLAVQASICSSWAERLSKGEIR